MAYVLLCRGEAEVHRLQSYGSAVTHRPLVPAPTEWDRAAWVQEAPELILVVSKGLPSLPVLQQTKL